MSEQPITLAALAKFHREVIFPDIQRIVGDAVSGSEGRLRNEMQGFHDEMLNGGVLPLDLLEARTETWVKAQKGGAQVSAGD